MNNTNKTDRLFHLLKLIGVNGYIKDNNMYFMTKDNEDYYDLKYYDNNSETYIFSKSIDTHTINDFYRIELYLNNYELYDYSFLIDNFELCFIDIRDGDYSYFVEKDFNCITFFLYEKDDCVIDINIYEDEIYFYNWKLGYEGQYSLEDDFDKEDFLVAKGLINSIKYFKLFLEYYSRNDNCFMEIYNSFEMDSAYSMKL